MFIIKCALHKLFSSRKLCLIFILSISAGLLCPIYVLGYIHTSLDAVARNRYKSPEDHILINSMMPYIEDETTAAYLLGETLGEYECAYQTTVNWENADGVSFVGGISPDIWESVPVYLMEGRLFNANDYKNGALPVCLLKTNNEMYLEGARVGDVISFMGTSCEVVGIVEGFGSKIIGSILVPYPLMDDVSGTTPIQHRFIVPKKENTDLESLQAGAQMVPDVNIISVNSLSEEEKEADAIYAAQDRNWLLAGFAVCLFAFFSIFAISVGRSLEEQRNMGIHKALGADRRKLFLEVLIQNLVIIAMALVMDGIILSFPWERIFFTKIYYSITCIVQVIGVSVLLALLLSFLSLRFMGKAVSQLISGQEQ